MSASDLSSLHAQVLWAAFVVSLLFGWIAQKTQFCTMGALSDIVNMGDWTRMRMWGMAVGVAAIGFYGMAYLGMIDATKTFYTNSRVVWLSGITGGALFGFGMVLASGCGSKTLVRIGGGSLKALVVFAVMGIAAFATLKGITAVARSKTVDAVSFDLKAGGSLPLLLADVTGLSASAAGLTLALLIGTCLTVWALLSAEFRQSNAVLAGLGIGACVSGMWWITGHLGFLPEHPETLEAVYLATNSGQMESMTFTAPMAYTLDWLIYFSDKNKVLTVGVVSVFGVVAGSLIQSVTSRSFYWEGFRNTQDTALHLVGAVLMGVGGVTAMGCTVGQGLSGLSTLGVTSLFAVLGILAGGITGLKFQLWLVMREA
jgi:uncharacterized membrane protein YedE/YeeE